MASTSANPGTRVTAARSVARLTEAPTTPGAWRMAFSTLAAHEAQCMPPTARLTLPTGTLKPARSTAFRISAGESFSGSYSTVACSVARLTEAEATPSSPLSAPSTTAAHEAQCMPDMGIDILPV